MLLLKRLLTKQLLRLNNISHLYTQKELVNRKLFSGLSKKSMEEELIDITLEQAKFIKNLRVVEGYTWRAVARDYSAQYMTSRSNNQILGIALCTSAMLLLEEQVEDGWN